MKCLICFSINEDPAPGPTGALLPHEKDLIQVHHHLLRGTEREVVLDLLHLVIAKKTNKITVTRKVWVSVEIRMGVLKCVY